MAFTKSIIPLSVAEAAALYPINSGNDGIDSYCSGPLRVNGPRVWWKTEGQSSFYTLCQKCYHENKLQLPDGTELDKDKLTPAYVSGLSCNCDGHNREGSTPINVAPGWNMGIYTCKTGDNADKFLLEERYINISQFCKVFEDTLYVPKEAEPVSYYFRYDSEEFKSTRMVIGIGVGDTVPSAGLHPYTEDGFREAMLIGSNIQGTIHIAQLVTKTTNANGTPTSYELKSLLKVKVDSMSNIPTVIEESETPEEITV